MSYRNWLSEIGIGLGLVIAILLALNFGELVSSKQIASSDKVEQPPAQHQATEKTPVETQFRVPPLSPTNPTREEHNGSSAQDSRPQADNHLFWGDGIAQWIMAVTGIAALVISAWAVWLVARSLRLNRQMLSATENANKAAWEAVGVTYKTAERQMRAYVGVLDAFYDRGTGQRKALVEIKNFGQTPAYDVQWQIYVKVIDFPTSHEFLHWIDDAETPKFALAPTGNMFECPDHQEISEHDLIALDAGRKAVFVYGEIRYRDAFKRDRFTQFRLMVGGDVGFLERKMKICTEGNTMGDLPKKDNGNNAS